MAKSTAKTQAARREAQQAETATVKPEEAAVQPPVAETATQGEGEARDDAGEQEKPPADSARVATPAAAVAPEEGAPPSGDDEDQGAQEDEEGKAAPPKATPSVGWVWATLKVRWASGGRPHEPGDKVRMSKSTYARLKKYGRVE